MNVNLRQIQALVSIARLGSFTKAANSLHLTPPALTVQIHHLEDVLGVRLLDRNTRSVKLTESGKEVVPILEGVLRTIDGVTANIRQRGSKTRGAVSIAALPSVCSMMLPVTIAKFRAECPDVSVTVRDATAQRIVTYVKAGEVDFGIGSMVEPDPGIQLAPLIDDRMKVVFAPGHPLEQQKEIALMDLVGFPLIAFESKSSVRSLVDRGFKSIGHRAPPAYEVTYASTAIGMAQAGLGIAIVPASSLRASTTRGIKSRAIKHPGFTREISVIRKSGRALSPAAESFLKSMHAIDWTSGGPMKSTRNHASQLKS
jgi:LysR family carnitine catabolism transcriptional activator